MNINGITKLHLACGLHTPEGWINVDWSWGAWLGKHRSLKSILDATHLLPRTADWPPNVLIHDLRKPLPFANDSISVIYSSNLLEHLYKSEARKLLRECHRVLSPGGVARVIVPDLAAIVREYCSGDISLEPLHSDNRADLFNKRLCMFESVPYRGSLLLRLYYLLHNPRHKYMYDEESLSACFLDAGFKQPTRRSLFDSQIPNVEIVEDHKHFTVRHDLCIEAVKD